MADNVILAPWSKAKYRTWSQHRRVTTWLTTTLCKNIKFQGFMMWWRHHNYIWRNQVISRSKIQTPQEIIWNQFYLIEAQNCQKTTNLHFWAGFALAFDISWILRCPITTLLFFFISHSNIFFINPHSFHRFSQSFHVSIQQPFKMTFKPF